MAYMMATEHDFFEKCNLFIYCAGGLELGDPNGFVVSNAVYLHHIIFESIDISVAVPMDVDKEEIDGEG